eukprot:TRINITY_DN2592_c0_g2_i1.p1 TRINITY_DN2592_c0_g2~~TRINITY_DN2592_c0_g2_i1.p1  ORF type:complete len:1121 (-),score=215.79 TRINITY_DN2592_c0_g2_i1:38-3400(-)
MMLPLVLAISSFSQGEAGGHSATCIAAGWESASGQACEDQKCAEFGQKKVSDLNLGGHACCDDGGGLCSTNVNADGYWTSTDWIDTCTGLDYIRVSKDCGVEVATEKNGTGDRYVYASSFRADQMKPGFDKIKSIRLFSTLGWLQSTASAVASACTSDADCITEMCAQGGADVVKGCGADKKCFHGVPDSKCDGVANYSGMQDGTRCSAVDGKALKVATCKAKPNCSAVGYNSVSGSNCDREACVEFGFKKVGDLDVLGGKCCDDDGGICRDNVNADGYWTSFDWVDTCNSLDYVRVSEGCGIEVATETKGGGDKYIYKSSFWGDKMQPYKDKIRSIRLFDLEGWLDTTSDDDEAMCASDDNCTTTMCAQGGAGVVKGCGADKKCFHGIPDAKCNGVATYKGIQDGTNCSVVDGKALKVGTCAAAPKCFAVGYESVSGGSCASEVCPEFGLKSVGDLGVGGSKCCSDDGGVCRTNVNADGYWTSLKWTDTCHGLDYVRVSKGCGIEVATEKNGGGETYVFTSDFRADQMKPGNDKIRSIRLFDMEGFLETTSSQVASACTTDDDCMTTMCDQGGADVVKGCGADKKCFHGIPDSKCVGVANYSGMQGGTKCSVVDGKALKVGTCTAKPAKCSAAGWESSSVEDCSGEKCVEFGFKKIEELNMGGRKCCDKDGGLCTQNADAEGYWTSSEWTDTCHGLDYVRVSEGCGIEVATESGGGGKTHIYTSDFRADRMEPGYDKIKSIRVFDLKGWLETGSDAFAACSSDADCSSKMCGQGGADVVKKCGSDGKCFHGIPDAKCAGVETYAGIQNGTKCSTVDGKALKVGTCEAVAKCFAAGFESVSPGSCADEACTAFGSKHVRVLGVGGNRCCSGDGGLCGSNVNKHGYWTLPSWVDTCHGLDYVRVSKGCGMEVATESNGAGETHLIMSDYRADQMKPGWDKVRSIRVFELEGFLWTSSEADASCETDADCNGDMCSHGGSENIKRCGTDKKCFHGIPDPKCEGAETYAGIQAGTKCSTIDGKAYKTGFCSGIKCDKTMCRDSGNDCMVASAFGEQMKCENPCSVKQTGCSKLGDLDICSYTCQYKSKGGTASGAQAAAGSPAWVSLVAIAIASSCMAIQSRF